MLWVFKSTAPFVSVEEHIPSLRVTLVMVTGFIPLDSLEEQSLCLPDFCLKVFCALYAHSAKKCLNSEVCSSNLEQIH